MQKSVEKWSKKTFLHFLALGPRMIWSIFTPYVCYLEGISTMWATPYVVKSLNKRNTRMFSSLFQKKQKLEFCLALLRALEEWYGDPTKRFSNL